MGAAVALSICSNLPLGTHHFASDLDTLLTFPDTRAATLQEQLHRRGGATLCR